MTETHRTPDPRTSDPRTPDPAPTGAADPAPDGAAAPGPVDPDRPVVDARSPQERRAAVEELRADLGATVSELAQRVDVPARVQARREELTAQARDGVDRARSAVDRHAPRVVRERPGAVTAAAVAAVLAVVVVSRVRARRA